MWFCMIQMCDATCECVGGACGGGGGGVCEWHSLSWIARPVCVSVCVCRGEGEGSRCARVNAVCMWCDAVVL